MPAFNPRSLVDPVPGTGLVEPTDGASQAKTPLPEKAPEEENRALVPLKEATRRAVERTERALIEEALRQTLWNRRKAAKLLEVSYSSLLRRIDAYGIGKKEVENEMP